jgi:hemoglobin
VNWADEFSAPTGSLQRATDPALGDDGEYPTLDQPSNVAVVSHAFSHGYHPRHTERLAAYWAESLSGPKRYSDIYGDETSVVRIHSGNGPHEEMDRRAIVCFDQALEDVGLVGDDPLRQLLHDYFEWATTSTMSRYHH